MEKIIRNPAAGFVLRMTLAITLISASGLMIGLAARSDRFRGTDGFCVNDPVVMNNNDGS